MVLHHFGNERLSTTLFALLLLGCVSGCAMVGPASVSSGRGDYNEAISRTENEQMLMAIVKGCYGETFSLLSVTGVAANVRFAANGGFQAGIGPSQNYVGNLIPLSGGVAYEENPTITYQPVQGEQYLRQLMAPIPLDVLVMFVRNSLNPAASLIMLSERINDMPNPHFLGSASVETDLRFQQFADLNKELIQAGILHWVEDPREKVPFAILITNWNTDHLPKVRDYLGLLGLSVPSALSEDIVLPVYFGIRGKKADCVAISTRSTYNLIQILRAATSIPSEHLANGLVEPFPELGLVGKSIRIHTSREEPENASTAVEYRDYWFYIDESDTKSKWFYNIMRTLWSATISGSADQKSAPILTIPLSR